MNKKNIIVLERLNIFTYIYFIINKLNTKYVYLCNSYQLESKKIKSKNKFLGVNLIHLSHSEEEKLTFEANKIALKYLKNDEFIVNSRIYGIVYKLIKSKKILIAFKKLILRNLQDRIRVYLVTQYLKKKYVDFKCKIIFSSSEQFNFLLHEKDLYQKNIETSVNLLIMNLFERLISLLLLFFCLPFWFLLKFILNGISLKKINNNQYLIGQHIAPGFRLPEYEKNKDSTRDDNHFIDPEYFTKKELIFIFSEWKFNKVQTKNYKRYLKQRGYKWIYEYKNKLQLNIIFKKLIPLIFSLFFRVFFIILQKKYFSLTLIESALRIVIYYFNFEFFCSNNRIKYFFSRDDINPKHIIRTIVLNKYGIKHVGIHHSGFVYPFVSSYLAYTYYDIYFIAGRGYYDLLYKDYWFSNKYIEVGQTYSNNIIKAQLNKELRNKFNKHYGNYINILVTVPTVDGTSPFDTYEIIKSKYCDFTDILQIHERIVLIFKLRNQSQKNKFISILNNYEKYNSRIFFEFQNFSTHELMAYSNILIGNDTSSALLEGLGNENLWVIPYLVRFTDSKDQIWSSYEPSLLCKNIDEICTQIQMVINNRLPTNYKKTRNLMKKSFNNLQDTNTWLKISNYIKSDFINSNK